MKIYCALITALCLSNGLYSQTGDEYFNYGQEVKDSESSKTSFDEVIVYNVISPIAKLRPPQNQINYNHSNNDKEYVPIGKIIQILGAGGLTTLFLIQHSNNKNFEKTGFVTKPISSAAYGIAFGVMTIGLVIEINDKPKR
jgi:hypothetical protein